MHVSTGVIDLMNYAWLGMVCGLWSWAWGLKACGCGQWSVPGLWCVPTYIGIGTYPSGP